MHARTKLMLLTAVPLMAAGCKSSPTIDNVTVTNAMTANTAAPADDGMINYADPKEAGNTGAAP